MGDQKGKISGMGMMGIFLAIWVVFMIAGIEVSNKNASKVRAVKAAQAKVYLSKNPIFPSLDNLADFVKTHFGETSAEAGHYIYRVGVFGNVDCVQAVWHRSFMNPGYYTYRIFSCTR